jgi:hypothetical protein
MATAQGPFVRVVVAMWNSASAVSIEEGCFDSVSIDYHQLHLRWRGSCRPSQLSALLGTPCRLVMPLGGGGDLDYRVGHLP